MNSLLSSMSYLNILSFYLINHGLDNRLFDIIMPIITDFGSLLAWFLIFGLMFAFGGQKTRKIAVLGVMALLIANVVVYSLKFFVAEPRPFLTLANVDLLVHAEETYSFPSGHAASSFAAAFVIGRKYKLKLKGKSYSLFYPLMIFAALVGFSRIYIGVHYPYDVLVGAIIGILSGYFALKLWNNNLIEKISRINFKLKT
ncbi:MAG: phosphatase PAP2 family protein [Methanobacterium sp. ERen5]|nr:MAG: phosphatase PAP2 family protein [Methanobacterium sp. ERen5]